MHERQLIHDVELLSEVNVYRGYIFSIRKDKLTGDRWSARIYYSDSPLVMHKYAGYKFDRLFIVVKNFIDTLLDKSLLEKKD